MTQLTKNIAVQAGIQAAVNQPSALLINMRVFDVEFNPFHANRVLERMNAIGKFGMDSPLHGGNLASITMSWHIHPPADGAATVPQENNLYRMSAFSPATADNETIYTPISDPNEMEFGHINLYMDGRLRTLYNCMCSAMSITINAGEIPIITATFVGHLNSDTDTPLPGNLIFSTEIPYVAKSASVQIGGYSAAKVKSLTFDLGFATPDRADMAEASSYAAPIITNRIVKGTVTMEKLERR